MFRNVIEKVNQGMKRNFSSFAAASAIEHNLLNSNNINTIPVPFPTSFVKSIQRSEPVNNRHLMPIVNSSLLNQQLKVEKDKKLTLDEEIKLMNIETIGMAENDPLSIIKWAKDKFQGRVAMSTSFGLQSSVLLHLATRIMPDIPVVWVDTGYLPPETYKYAEELKETLNLNLIVATNTEWTPARMEAVHGKLWETNHSLYGKMRKVIPLKSGLDSIQPQPLALFSGLRAGQTKARSQMEVIGHQHGRFKILPMLKMSDKDVVDYMDKYDLPKHPLQSKGYLSVGDWHSSRPAEKGEDARATRFGGKFEECGLHVDEPAKAETKPNSSPSASTSVSSQPSQSQNEGIINADATHQTPKHQSQPLKPGLESLSIVKAHQDTGLAVIMVKKRLEDGSMCRKCQDVSDKIEKDAVGDQIGYTAIANVLDPSSEGSVLAKHFDVATAPFFLVRTIEEEKKHMPWKPIRSYLQFKKIVQAAQDRAEEARANGSVPKKDPKLEAEEHRIKELKAQIAVLQAQVLKAEHDLKLMLS